MSNLLKAQRTHYIRNEDIEREWLLVNASGQILGKLASAIAHRLQGKHRVDYSPHQSMGTCVVVIQARQVLVTGKKREQKVYYRHSGYTGSLRAIKFEEMMEKAPEEIIKLAVKRMLSSGPRGRALLSNLRIYPDMEHPHQAQKLQVWDFSSKGPEPKPS